MVQTVGCGLASGSTGVIHPRLSTGHAFRGVWRAKGRSWTKACRGKRCRGMALTPMADALGSVGCRRKRQSKHGSRHGRSCLYALYLGALPIGPFDIPSWQESRGLPSKAIGSAENQVVRLAALGSNNHHNPKRHTSDEEREGPRTIGGLGAAHDSCPGPDARGKPPTERFAFSHRPTRTAGRRAGFKRFCWSAATVSEAVSRDAVDEGWNNAAYYAEHVLQRRLE